jgi:hypothetical protein
MPTYWVTGLNFSYGIVAGECPEGSEVGHIGGPFTSLSEAKRHARELIANDRMHLQSELDAINRYKASDLKAQGDID